MNWWWSKQKQEEIATWLAEQSPIILMGRGHSGTRVLSWACMHLGINLGASDSLATGDADDQQFTQQIKKIATNNVGITSKAQINTSDLQLFQKAVYQYYQRLSEPKKLWGWKFPETYLIAPYVAETFPKARYLHLIRDGRDIAFKQHLTDDAERKLGKRILDHQNALQLPRHLQAGISWAFQVDTYQQFAQSLPPEQNIELKFEDLCQQPRETVDRLCQFLKLPLTPDCEDYISNSINAKKVSQYRENDANLVQEVEAKIGKTLTRYQYL